MNTAQLQKQFLVGTIIFFVSFCASLGAQTRPVAILGGTLIDGTGRAPVTDAAIVIQGGRFQQVGKRVEVSVPQGAEVIEAGGKTILPGLIDGHCHYQDWAGELNLAFGVTTCPAVSRSSPDQIATYMEGIKNGTIRGPRVWTTGTNVDGPPIPAMRERRRQRSGVVVRTPEEARKAVRELVDKGVDGLKFYERLTPELAKAAAGEAHRHGKPVLGHSLDIFASAEAGYQSVEHSWAVAFTSVEDPEERRNLDAARESGKLSNMELYSHMQPERFDRIIQVMVENNLHWSPTTATLFRLLSPRSEEMKRREAAIFNDPRFHYSSPRLAEGYESFEKATPEGRAKFLEGYRMVQDFMRRFVAAGGKIDSGSDPNTVPPAYGLHVEIQLLVEAGLTPVQAIQTASLNVAQTWMKDTDYGSVEIGKVADLVIVGGDPLRDISTTQNVEMVFMDGKLVGGSSYMPVPDRQ